MTKGKYSDDTVWELLDDLGFIALVSHEDPEEWERFVKTRPEPDDRLTEVREIVLTFRTREGKLPENMKRRLWGDIDRFDRLCRRKRRLKSFAWAASIAVMLALGSALYLHFPKQPAPATYHFTGDVADGKTLEAPLLVLADGQQVNLEKKESEISVLKKDEGIQINQDRVVKNEATKPAALNEVIIPYGRKSKLVLGDGTRVCLNAGSRFAFPQQFDGKNRTVFLEGEAYFEVAKDEKAPFIVHAGAVSVEVTGTKFNLSAYQSDQFSETVLVAGSVNVIAKGKGPDQKVAMTPNQKAVFDKEQKTVSVQDELAPGLYTGWVDGWYQFVNEDIERVLRKLERYYNVSFHYEEEILADALPVSGKLDLKDSLEAVMPIISKVAKIHYRMEEEGILITGWDKEEI